MEISFNSNMVNGFTPRRRKFGIGSLILLVLVGVIFIGVGILAFQFFKIDPSWQKVTGQVASSSTSITNGQASYAPVVQYKVGTQTYQITSSIGSSTPPQIGEGRQVAYNPSQPAEAKLVGDAASTWWLYLFPIVGVALLIIAPFAFISSLRRGRTIHHLVQDGQKLQGIITGIQSYGGNGNSASNSYKITVSATDSTGTVQTYVSDSLVGIGGLAMADFRTTPIPIDIYINPADPQDYYVDVSEVPNLTPERITELIKAAAERQNGTINQ